MSSLYSIADLTEELGLSADHMSDVAAFSGEIEGLTAKVFTRAWMDEMIEVWNSTTDPNAD